MISRNNFLNNLAKLSISFYIYLITTTISDKSYSMEYNKTLPL